MRFAAHPLLILVLFALPFSHALAEEVRAPRPTTTEATALTAADSEAIQKLFGQVGQGFLRGSSADVLKLFVPKTAELRQVPEPLEAEFSQSVYKRFEAVEFRTADAEWLRPNVWIVDVVLILESAPRHAQADAQKVDRSYRTSYPFIVQRMPDGSFMLRHSEFFQSLGLRYGPGLLLQGAGLIALVALALTLYVWMGWEALRERPRVKFWRTFTLVPLLGTLAYFLMRLLPRWMKKS